MRVLMIQALLVLCIAALPAAPGAMAMEGYLRTPDVHGETVVFTAEGDLWLVPVTGGTATRLTTHAGAELYPHFSPDGRQIAFSGGYDGNGDVFVVSAGGGEPRRMTWHPSVDQVIGWTPDGKHILFRSTRENPHGTWEMFKVPAAGGDPEKLPLGWAARIDIEAGRGLWAFNRTERIYRGAPADNEPSPLAQPGVGVKEGDYLLAVNGRPFDADRPVHAAFEGLAGKAVLFTVNDSPAREEAREVVIATLPGSDRSSAGGPGAAWSASASTRTS